MNISLGLDVLQPSDLVGPGNVVPTNARTTEAGAIRTTESGITRVIE